MTSITVLIPLLQWIATAAGAGAAANALISYARRTWPLEPPNRAGRLAYQVIHAPRSARLLAFVLSAVIGLSAQAMLAAASGGDVLSALDTGLAAIVAGQLLHGARLSATTPAAAQRLAASSAAPMRVPLTWPDRLTPEQQAEYMQRPVAYRVSTAQPLQIAPQPQIGTVEQPDAERIAAARRRLIERRAPSTGQEG